MIAIILIVIFLILAGIAGWMFFINGLPRD